MSNQQGRLYLEDFHPEVAERYYKAWDRINSCQARTSLMSSHLKRTMEELANQTDYDNMCNTLLQKLSEKVKSNTLINWIDNSTNQRASGIDYTTAKTNFNNVYDYINTGKQNKLPATTASKPLGNTGTFGTPSVLELFKQRNVIEDKKDRDFYLGKVFDVGYMYLKGDFYYGNQRQNTPLTTVGGIDGDQYEIINEWNTAKARSAFRWVDAGNSFESTADIIGVNFITTPDKYLYYTMQARMYVSQGESLNGPSKENWDGDPMMYVIAMTKDVSGNPHHISMVRQQNRAEGRENFCHGNPYDPATFAIVYDMSLSGQKVLGQIGLCPGDTVQDYWWNNGVNNGFGFKCERRGDKITVWTTSNRNTSNWNWVSSLSIDLSSSSYGVDLSIFRKPCAIGFGVLSQKYTRVKDITFYPDTSKDIYDINANKVWRYDTNNHTMVQLSDTIDLMKTYGRNLIVHSPNTGYFYQYDGGKFKRIKITPNTASSDISTYYSKTLTTKSGRSY